MSESQLAHDQAPSEDASVDADQPLLRFSNISQDQILLDYNCQRVTVSISARLDGYFSLAQSSLAAESDSAMPLDLTCYRRNLLQVTGTVSIPRHLHTILLQHGENAEIVGQELSLSAYESTEGSPVRIIVVPWKTSVIRLAVPSPDDKTEKEPSTIKLDLAGGREVEGDLVMFSFAWKRLQFRIATANNGRRKELQQHFVIKLQVFVHLRGGSKISVCSAESMPTIVRGRSPRNFQSRRDFPLSSGSVTGKRSTAKAPQPARSKTGEPGKSQAKRADRPAKSQQVQFKKVKTSPATKTVATSKSSEHNEPVEGDLQPHHYVNWKPQYCQSIPTSLHSRQAKEMASGAAAAASAGAGAGATGAGPGIGGVTHPHTLSDLSHVLTSQLVHGPISAPIDLSVLDEEQPRRASASSVQQNKAAAVVAAAATTPSA